jgi:two-component system, chemotaxis family, sensor kinase CheA
MDDLIAEFITETSESLSMLDSELVKLEQNPNDTQILGNIFRLVHTIKGTCGFLGLPRLESVAHAGENVLGKVRDKEIAVTPKAISMVLEALDRIKMIMDYLSENASEPEGEDSDLIRRLNAFADSNGASDGTDGVVVEAPAEVDLEAIFAATAVLEPASQPETPPAEIASVPVAVEAPPPPAPVKAPTQELPAKLKEEAVKQALNTPAPAHDEGGGASGANQTIRVNLSVLENLMQMVGELVLTRNQLLQLARSKNNDDFATPLQHLSYITSELQEGVMKTRMQPISNAWAKFPRLIRDLSMELGKKIDLKMLGSETELDRQLLEMIKDPLTHMVRNSCDHGLERPDERVANGKSETGTVILSAYHEGGHIIIEINDDGRGVNTKRVKQKAVENGLATEEELATMTDNQIIQYIFKPGFSTAEAVTSISGRGVGMDVVRTNIEKIGGTVELNSWEGKGSNFHIKIPLTLAIVSVLIVETKGQPFALPQINVVELVKIDDDIGQKVEMINNAPILRLRGKLLPLISLAQVLKMEHTAPTSYDQAFVVVCKVGGSEFGLIVEVIHDTEEIVVKPVSRCLQHIPVYSGNTVLGDGSVIMILDPNGISKTTETELESTTAATKQLESGHGNGNAPVNFLLFHTDDKTPKAVALELVSRLEEINVSEIEYSNGEPVVQYRDDLMCLTTVGDHPLPESGMCEVIVFNYDCRTVGLVVRDIADIVAADPMVQLPSNNDMYHGSIIMKGHATDILDVGKLLSRVRRESPVVLFENESLKALRVLLVEDSMFFRNLTVPFLSEVGFQVIAAPSGRDALTLLQKQEFDVVVTDIEMPLMDGFELALAIRAQTHLRHVPIYAFTSTANENVERRVNECGMQGYVLKTEREKLIHLISCAKDHMMLEAV